MSQRGALCFGFTGIEIPKGSPIVQIIANRRRPHPRSDANLRATVLPKTAVVAVPFEPLRP